jgi:hypothetical protein
MNEKQKKGKVVSVEAMSQTSDGTFTLNIGDRNF